MENSLQPTGRFEVLVGFGALAGALVVALSPALTGHREPWDANFGLYLLYILAVGLVAGLLSRRGSWFWCCPLGLYLGQVVASLAVLEIGPTSPLGIVVFLPLMSVVNLVGWTAGYGARSLISAIATRGGSAVGKGA